MEPATQTSAPSAGPSAPGGAAATRAPRPAPVLEATAAGRALAVALGLALVAAVAAADTPLGPAASLGAGLGVAALGVGAPLARRNLRGLAVERARSATAAAGEAFDLVLVLAQRGRGAARDVALQPGPRVRARPAGLLSHLAPGARGEVAARHRIPRRGRHDAVELVLSSTFPFGLFRATVRVTVPTRLWILPRALPVVGVDDPDRARRDRALGRPLAARGDEEFHGLRERRAGEPPRRVHWPLSLRRGRTLLREHEAEAPPPVRVWLSCFVPRGASAARRERSFERAVTLAASLVVHWARRGLEVELVVAGATRVEVPAARGRAGLLPALLALADALPVAAPLAERDAADADHTVVVLVGGGRGPERAHGVPPAAFLVLDVERPDSDALLVRSPTADSFSIGAGAARPRAPLRRPDGGAG